MAHSKCMHLLYIPFLFIIIRTSVSNGNIFKQIRQQKAWLPRWLRLIAKQRASRITGDKSLDIPSRLRSEDA